MQHAEPHSDCGLVPAPLPRVVLFRRLFAIAVLLAMTAGFFLYAGGWFASRDLTPATLVNMFEHLNGRHPGFRRNHAKGVCVTGYFVSNGAGQELSSAQVFRPGRVPVEGRFALAGGQPFANDTPTTVRSLAILFRQSDGEEWRTAMINIPVFPVNTPEDFRSFTIASSLDPHTNTVNTAARDAFVAGHPETAAALKVIGGHPFSSGFADSPYYALNAFRFVNGEGHSTPIRWWLKPDQAMGGTEPGTQTANYLFDSLISQIHSRNLTWHLILTVGQPGDKTAEAATAWPADRRQIDVGTLTIETVESEDTSQIRDIVFDPLVLPDGILPSDDPLLNARSAAYSQSFVRREGEKKVPSAISPQEVRR